jgi:uncharacterized protein (TIGR00730 family)
MKRICVFCGSSAGSNPAYHQAARQIGAALVRRGLGLVYGGGGIGLMGMLAEAVLSAGGEVIGVIPGMLDRKEVAHTGLSRRYVVASMHERKAKMAELADAFVALPGGMGTLEELTEVLTWGQLGLHRKPCGLLDVGGYYRPLISFFDHAVAEGFLQPRHRAMIQIAEEPEALLDRLASYRPPPHVQKWIDERET